MSGGSYDYFYRRCEEFAEEIVRRHPDSILHRAFGAHMALVAVAAHAVEWEDSCDGWDGWQERIRDVISKPAEIAEAVRQARLTIEALGELIEDAEAMYEVP